MTSTFKIGSLIKLVGLEAMPELNGQLGVIKHYHNDKGRYEVIPSRGSETWAIKPCNLTQDGITTDKDASFREQKHQIMAFWPAVDGKEIPVQGFDDWPEDWIEEKAYLKRTLNMKKPTIVSGIENEGSAKPDFQMYFDGGDDESPENKVAQAFGKLLPGYEWAKVNPSFRGKPIRGVCILVYSPMKSTFYSSGLPPMISGDPNRQFSLEQLREVLKFHTTKRARAQYKAHDRPMHRMFGDLM